MGAASGDDSQVDVIRGASVELYRAVSIDFVYTNGFFSVFVVVIA
jgi:hypothetical protein